MTRRLAKKILLGSYTLRKGCPLTDAQIDEAARRLARGAGQAKRASIGERSLAVKANARMFRGDLRGFLSLYVRPPWLRALDEDPAEASRLLRERHQALAGK